MAAESSSMARIKLYRPFFSPAEVERLSAKQRGKLSVSREEKGRQQACTFIDAVGTRCGLKTIATAQTLYMRFHLFFPYRDFNHVEVSLSVLYVSSKLHDTLKKPRDIILQSYPLRYPNLVKKGTIDPSALDPRMLEDERTKVLTIERLVLETICFKFGVETGLGSVLKIGRALGLDKVMCQHAWRVVVDCYRTQAPLSFPPHLLALASIYSSALLLMESTDPSNIELEKSDSMTKRCREVIDQLSASGTWEEDYSATPEQIDSVTHYLLDLYITTSSSNPGQPIEPSPVSPAERPTAAATSLSTPNTAFALPTFWNAQTLTELKIYLRTKRPGRTDMPSWPDSSMDGGEEEESIVEGIGRNEGTVRFVWDKQDVSVA